MQQKRKKGAIARITSKNTDLTVVGFDYSTFSTTVKPVFLPLLDPIGTSQKPLSDKPSLRDVTMHSPSLMSEIDQMREDAKGKRCYKDAPLICIPGNGVKENRIFQGCCNDWQCPRCGMMRANYEFARMTHGASELIKQGKKLAMMTITPKGKIETEEAEQEYGKATNHLLTRLRDQVKNTGGDWFYVQVTERQRRGHPHSHFMCTFLPDDAFLIDDEKGYEYYKKAVAEVNALIPEEMRFYPKEREDIAQGEMYSVWLALTAVDAGLGVQVNLSRVISYRSVVSYMAKYMFKSALDTKWPKGWKRVRYSQSWPKFEEQDTEGAFAVLRAEDWKKVALLRGKIYTDDTYAYKKCLEHYCLNVSCTVPIDFDENEIFNEGWREIIEHTLRVNGRI